MGSVRPKVAAVLVFAGGLALTGCQSGSTLSLTYLDGDESRTVSMSTKDVRCENGGASAMIIDKPRQGGFQFSFSRSVGEAYFGVDDDVVIFETNKLNAGVEDGRVRFEDVSGVVTIGPKIGLEEEPPANPGSLATSTTGTLTVDLKCRADE